MSNDRGKVAAETCPGMVLSRYSELFRKRRQRSQASDNRPRKNKPAPDAIASVTRAVSRCRLKRLTTDAILNLIREHHNIAEWYTLEFFRQTGGLDEKQFNRWDFLESWYGVAFLRSYTQQPIPGDIQTAFEPNFWFLQGKIHMLMWLLGESLTEITFGNGWDYSLPSDFRASLQREESASNESQHQQVGSALIPPRVQTVTGGKS